jgi:hypothetical protein
MISKTLFARYASDPAKFRADLLVDVDGVARRFGDVMDPWQRDDFAAIDPGLQRCNGRKPDAEGLSRAYLERGRGHSKTTDLAIMSIWALAFATRPIRGYCFAADRDQAALLKDAMATICRLNPWLAAILDVQKNLVVNIAKDHPGEGGQLEIFTSDVASSYGILPDLIIADELVHWEGDGSLWHSIISSAAKRSNCLLVVITNAGFIDSWQWAVREAARLDEAWYFSRLDGPRASWLTPARLAEQRRMLPAIAYARLWENQWSSGGGDALTKDDIDAAFKAELRPVRSRESGWLYVAGIDLGLTRDRSSVVALAVPDDGNAGRIRLAADRLWRPLRGKKIDLMDVERYVLALDELLGLEFVSADPWQAELLCQRLEADSDHRRRNQRRVFGSQPWVRATPPTAANLRQQATVTIECFQDRRLDLYECGSLRDDLSKARVEERQGGFRLVSPKDSSGHGDTFSAFAHAIVLAHEVAGKRPTVAGAVSFDPNDDYILPGDPRSPKTGLPMPGMTAYDYAQQEFELDRQEYQEEMRRLSRPNDDQERWRELMRDWGRSL